MLTPQGTLAEKLRAGGAGIPAFYTKAGVGTQVSDGGLPQKYDADGGVAIASAPKEVRTFNGVDYVLEESLTPDYGLVHAWKGDRHGNLVFHATAMNFNPLCAMAGRITIAEVEELVEPGELDPEHVHVPGIFVQRVVVVARRREADRKADRVPGCHRPELATAAATASNRQERSHGVQQPAGSASPPRSRPARIPAGPPSGIPRARTRTPKAGPATSWPPGWPGSSATGNTSTWASACPR